MRFLAFIAALFFVTAAHAAPVRVDYDAGHATGFTIGSGLVVTAAHVVAGANGKTITLFTEDKQKVEAKPVWANYSVDVAVLKIDPEAKDFDPPEDSVMKCDADPTISTDIEIIGNPWGESFVHTWGKVGTGVIKTQFWPKAIMVDATIAHGESGGPVIADGKVVGMEVGIEDDNSFGFVIPATTICKLVAGNKP